MSEENSLSIRLLVNNPGQDTNSDKKKTSALIKRSINQQPSIPEKFKILAKEFLLTPDLDGFSTSYLPVDNSVQLSKSKDDERKTRCICTNDMCSPNMVLCDSCKFWLHCECVKLKNFDQNPFFCLYCQYQMKKAVQDYVRKRLSVLAPYLHSLENNRQLKISELSNELQIIMRDVQETLDTVYNCIPTKSTN